MDYTVHGILQARILERISHSFLQGIFPTQGWNPGPLHCRRILYQLSHKEDQEHWRGQPVSSPAGLSDPGIESGSPALQAYS